MPKITYIDQDGAARTVEAEVGATVMETAVQNDVPGILAVCAITGRVVAVDGMIGVRPMMTLTLSSDHRVVDGARAAVFLNDIALALSEPEKWL